MNGAKAKVTLHRLPTPGNILLVKIVFQVFFILEQDLIGRIVVFVFAGLVGRKRFTQLRPVSIFCATVVHLQMAAWRRYLDHPIILVINTNHNLVVHQKPTQIIVIGFGFRSIEL